MMAWHYTIGERATDILRDGVIRPATAFVPDTEVPVVWFSTNQFWEPTANKGIIENGVRRGLTMRETVELGGGGWRFGLPVSRLIYYRKMHKLANLSRKTAKGLERAAKSCGADHRKWWGAIEPVKVSDCIVQRLDGKIWLPVD